MRYSRHVRRGLVLAALALALAAAVPATGSADARADFIVVLDRSLPRAAPVAAEHAARFDGSVSFVYEHALKGYAISLTEGAAAELARDRRVVSVERDDVVSISTTQPNATWGLDRIDQRSLPLSGTYSYTNTGAGVTAYIIDTGIRFSHADFGGRASSGFDSVDGGSADDCHGHGTHVAGTVGGATWGVAKGVSLVAVRVLNCSGSGTWAGVIAGVDWVTGHHTGSTPAVANMSLGGGVNSAIDTAVSNSIADGVSYAIAAGNSRRDACRFSPARVSTAMTIGASDSSDRRASFSNYGDCVDWFAPGVGITSAWSTSDNATNTISGTSMATPHTAGVAALYLQSNSSASPAAVRNALYANATQGIIGSARSANNHLLFTNY